MLFVTESEKVYLKMFQKCSNKIFLYFYETWCILRPSPERQIISIEFSFRCEINKGPQLDACGTTAPNFSCDH